jgi:glycosyltransferase involved in cell wall biosynthesis
MPSSAEAFGLVYTEAWYFGKPVVGGPAVALKELISDGHDGYIIPQDKTRLIDVLDNLLRDRSLRQRLGQQGKEKQRSLYTWDNVLKRHLTAWSALCA